MRIAKPVSHQNFERNLHFPLGSMSVGVLVHPHHNPLSHQKESITGLVKTDSAFELTFESSDHRCNKNQISDPE
jgi:hypothetical protein